MTTTGHRHAIRRTPLWHKQRAMGARMAERFGWEIAEACAAAESELAAAHERAALADVSWLAKLDLKGSGGERGMGGLSALVETDLCGKPDLVGVWHLACGHALVTCEPQDQDPVETALARVLDGASLGCVHVTDVTSVYAALLLVGPRNREVLNRLTALDVSDAALPVGACAQTGLAHTHTIVLRRDVGFLLLVGWEYGEYVWDAVMEAGACVGIEPIGLAVAEQLRQDLVVQRPVGD